MTKRAELLTASLNTLNAINESTQVALEVLRTNSETAAQIIEELMYGAEEGPTPDLHVMPFFDDVSRITQDGTDDINSMANKIVNSIRSVPDDGEGEIRAVDIKFDAEKFDPDELMELVQRKLMEEETPEKPKEEVNDEFNFDNPLE